MKKRRFQLSLSFWAMIDSQWICQGKWQFISDVFHIQPGTQPPTFWQLFVATSKTLIICCYLTFTFRFIPVCCIRRVVEEHRFTRSCGNFKHNLQRAVNDSSFTLTCMCQQNDMVAQTDKQDRSFPGDTKKWLAIAFSQVVFLHVLSNW